MPDDAAARKLASALENYRESPDLGFGFARVYRHKDDERHIVVDDVTKKILKRFKDSELSWSDAQRFAHDYARQYTGIPIGVHSR